MDREFNEYGEAFEDGVIVALDEEHRQEHGDLAGLNEWCIVGYNKWGAEVEHIWPISSRTGDKAAVDTFRRQYFADQWGGDDLGTWEANRRGARKHFTRVMPTKDFLRQSAEE